VSARARRLVTPEFALLAGLVVLLAGAVLYPLASVLSAALVPGGRPIVDFFARPAALRAFANSVLAGALVALSGSVIGVALALLTTRFDFRGRLAVMALGAVPLLVPTFVGAAALREIFGAEGFAGVVLAQSLLFFPFIMLSTAAALSGLDRALEEAGQSLGARRLLVFRRIVLPLAWPGYAAGALLAFVRAVDDLGAPLMLGYPELLAPRAYLRIAENGAADADGAVACVAMLALTAAGLWAVQVVLSRGARAEARGAVEAPAAFLGARGTAVAWLVAAALLGPALLPPIGIALLSVARVWSQSLLPTAYTLDHYEAILVSAPRFVWNTIGYSALAAAVDVLLGAAIAWLLLRSAARGRAWLRAMAAAPLVVPGVVIAAGYLGALGGSDVPGIGAPLTATWLVLVAVYAVRRLPHSVRGGRAALGALPAALEEAAQSLGADRGRTFAAITLPLVARGLAATGLLAFAAAVADFSSTLLLVPRPELGPLSYGMYVSMQSAIGRGPGAALGAVAVVLVAGATWAATRLARRSITSSFRV
jgi:iron(III) transport system permease protein